MRTIRQNTFETNSSSSHSVTIVSDDLDESYKGKSLHLEGGEFGWGVERYSDSETKANYLFTWCVSRSGDDNTDRTTNDDLDKLCTAIENYTGVNVTISSGSGDRYYPYGYIDHQSSDVGGDIMYCEREIIDFIFGTRSELMIDNDNY